MKHTTTTRVLTPTAGETVYRGECSCKTVGQFTPYRSEAQDWIDAHEEEVVRARIHRSSRVPSLEDQAKWYRMQEAGTDNPREKAQWAGLAHELEHRLGQDDHSEQPSLLED